MAAITPTDPDRLALTQVPGEIAAAGYEPASYKRLYLAVIDCRVPAVRGSNGRWTVARSDLSTIAEALGLERADAPAAS